MVDLTYLTVSEASELLAARQVSSVELTRFALERIERLDRSIGAFLLRTPELAMSQAAHADKIKAHSLTGRITPDLMWTAFRNVKRNRGAAGIDKVSIQMYERNLMP